jgi:hypothetical protein
VSVVVLESWQVGGWYGRVGVEILAGGRCIAVVNRIGSNRLGCLDQKRSALAKRGEPAFEAEREAQELEGEREEALATARRAVACVSVCAGIPTEDLERVAALESYLRLLKLSCLADQQAATFEGPAAGVAS